MSKVLWIEDEAKDQLIEYLAPLIHAGHIVDIAEDASEGYLRLKETQYDVIIFDLLIKAGLDFSMDEEYPGLALLRKIFIEEENSLRLNKDRIMVFTVVMSSEINDDIKKMGIKNIKVKERMERTKLKTLIDEILK